MTQEEKLILSRMTYTNLIQTLKTTLESIEDSRTYMYKEQMVEIGLEGAGTLPEGLYKFHIEGRKIILENRLTGQEFELTQHIVARNIIKFLKAIDVYYIFFPGPQIVIKVEDLEELLEEWS